MPATPSPMPVCFPPALDELLSSLIRRHAVFYNVPPLAVLHHAVPNLRSLKAADRDLTQDQAEALAIMFRTTATAVFGMTFAIAPGATRRLISSRVMQECQTCYTQHAQDGPVLRSQLQGWRITCPTCDGLLRDPDGLESQLSPNLLWRSASRGEQLLHREAHDGSRHWISPAVVARLLLVPRFVRWGPDKGDYRRARLLGLVIPEFDRIALEEPTNIANSGKPILPLHLRPFLLAGVAVVLESGPEMLDLLRRHAIGVRRELFDAFAAEAIAQWVSVRAHSQKQLI
jgi:hypothetical protein